MEQIYVGILWGVEAGHQVHGIGHRPLEEVQARMLEAHYSLDYFYALAPISVSQ
jgi:hypothetical protein